MSAPASAWSAWPWRAACRTSRHPGRARSAACRAGAPQYRSATALADRVRVIEADVTRPLGEIAELAAAAESFDHVLANPPFNIEGRGTAAGDAMKAAANAMPPGGNLERWVRFMAAMARPGGTATLIHRAEALGEILGAIAGRFGGIARSAAPPARGGARRRACWCRASRAAARPGAAARAGAARRRPTVSGPRWRRSCGTGGPRSLRRAAGRVLSSVAFIP